MKKKIFIKAICTIMAIVSVFSAMATLSLNASAKTNSNYNYVMTAEEFCTYLIDLYRRGDTFYCNTSGNNLGYYSENHQLLFDCMGLGKAILLTKGEITRNYTVGVNGYNNSLDIGDMTENELYEICVKTGNDFSDLNALAPGSWLFIGDPSPDGTLWHVGYYIGEFGKSLGGNVIEITYGYGIKVTNVDNKGASDWDDSDWAVFGQMPMIDYSAQNAKIARYLAEKNANIAYANSEIKNINRLYRTTSSYTLRSSPLSDSGSVAWISRGTYLKVLSSGVNQYGSRWLKVCTPNYKIGYIFCNYVSPVSINAPVFQSISTTRLGRKVTVNMKNAPSYGSYVISATNTRTGKTTYTYSSKKSCTITLPSTGTYTISAREEFSYYIGGTLKAVSNWSTSKRVYVY